RGTERRAIDPSRLGASFHPPVSSQVYGVTLPSSLIGARNGRSAGCLIAASTFRVSLQGFAVPPPIIPCFKRRKIVVKGLKIQADLGDLGIWRGGDSAKFAVNSLLAGNLNLKTGSRQTGTTASPAARGSPARGASVEPCAPPGAR